MVLALIGIAIAVLVVVILIIKASKTSSMDIMGIDMHCRQCGIKINGLTCPKCENKPQSFDI